MKSFVIINPEKAGYHFLSDAVKLIAEYTKSWDIDWSEFDVVKSHGWRIYFEHDTHNWILTADDPGLLMYVELKL